MKAYIAEWSKFFTQCDYLPKPFNQLEVTLAGKAHSTLQKKNQGEESIVRKVRQNGLFLLVCIIFGVNFLCSCHGIVELVC